MRTLAVLAMLALPLAANAAEIYRCVDRGVVTYQDFACRTPDSGKVVRLAPEPPPRANNPDDLETMRKRVDTMARERRQREIALEIDNLQRSLTRQRADEAVELDALRDRRKFIGTTLGGDPFGVGQLERQLANEMAAVSARYRDKAEATDRRIARLRDESKALTPQPQ